MERWPLFKYHFLVHRIKKVKVLGCVPKKENQTEGNHVLSRLQQDHQQGLPFDRRREADIPGLDVPLPSPLTNIWSAVTSPYSGELTAFAS